MDHPVGYVFYYDSEISDTISKANENKTPFNVIEESEGERVCKTRQHFRKYKTHMFITLARTWGNLVKVKLLYHETANKDPYEPIYREGETIYEKYVRFSDEVNHSMLGRDVLGLITSNLNQPSKTYLRTTAKTYAKNISPPKKSKTRTMSPILFNNLREMYTLEEMATLFIRFPEIVEACIDNGFNYKQKLSKANLLHTSRTSFLKYCFNQEAYATIRMIAKKFDIPEKDYWKHSMGEIKYLKHKKSNLPDKEQWENLHRDSYNLIQSIEKNGYTTFAYNGENLLRERLSDTDSRVVQYLMLQDGIEKDFYLCLPDLALREHNSSFVIADSKLVPEDSFLDLFKSMLITGDNISFHFACIAALRGYDLSNHISYIASNLITGVLDMTERNTDLHTLNVLRCTEINKPLITEIEEEFVKTHYMKPISQEFVSIITNLGSEDTENFEYEFKRFVEESVDDFELSNFVMETCNKEFYTIVPKRIKDEALDFIASSNPFIEERVMNVSTSHGRNQFDLSSFKEILMKRISLRYPLSIGRIRPINTENSIRLLAQTVLFTDIELIGRHIVNEIDRGQLVLPYTIKFDIHESNELHRIRAIEEFKKYLLKIGFDKDIDVQYSKTTLRDYEEGTLIIKTNSLDHVAANTEVKKLKNKFNRISFDIPRVPTLEERFVPLVGATPGDITVLEFVAKHQRNYNEVVRDLKLKFPKLTEEGKIRIFHKDYYIYVILSHMLSKIVEHYILTTNENIKVNTGLAKLPEELEEITVTIWLKRQPEQYIQSIANEIKDSLSPIRGIAKITYNSMGFIKVTLPRFVFEESNLRESYPVTSIEDPFGR